MEKCMNDVGSAKRVFQTLPRHLRRRAMSHNVYKLPVRLRQKAIEEVRSFSSDLCACPSPSLPLFPSSSLPLSLLFSLYLTTCA